MADDSMIEITTAHALPSDTVIVSDGTMQEAESEAVTEEDILQQAFEEATETFNESGVEYAVTDDQTDAVVQQIADSVAATGTTLVQVASTSDIGENGYETTTYTVVGAGPEDTQTVTFAHNDQILATDADHQIDQSQLEALSNAIYASTSSDTGNVELDGTENEIHTVFETESNSNSSEIGTSVDVSSGLSVTLVPTNRESGAPLGSCQNPIRIIQQGNQYTPVQHLTAEQLQQIMQVVQEQQLAKSTSEGGGSSILYNPQTNTRIVYRVIYPSELHKTGESENQKQSGQRQSQGQQTVVVSFPPKRTYRKRNKEDEPGWEPYTGKDRGDPQLDAPELSREEKDERKKHRPRTRSGRVSKPPKHMVKDYKHIHTVDWDEDPYDDSDAGYSDFKESDHEEEDDNDDAGSEKADMPYLGKIRLHLQVLYVTQYCMSLERYTVD
jgi:hypothetical protein